MATQTPPESPPRRSGPVLRVTRYDLVTAGLIAAVIALTAAVLWLLAVWLTNRLSEPENDVPLELMQAGGFEDGAIDETLELQSPEEVVQDPSLAEIPAEQTQVEKMLENVIELSDQATNQLSQTFEPNLQSTGNPGSAEGTGRRALGVGPGTGGLPRAQRWFVHFSQGTLSEYARQLDYFGIELGALFPGSRIVYVSRLSSASPRTRTVTSGEGEQRLYMTWQSGARRAADLKLMEKAGVDVTGATVLHFYPPATEAKLARLERAYRNRTPDEIRRTYFAVQKQGDGYRFIVTRQTYFN